jgi:hypothetical protein
MSCRARLAIQLRTVGVAHFGNLGAAGIQAVGRIAEGEIADSGEIAVDWAYIGELGVSIQVVEGKAAGKLP